MKMFHRPNKSWKPRKEIERKREEMIEPFARVRTVAVDGYKRTLDKKSVMGLVGQALQNKWGKTYYKTLFELTKQVKDGDIDMSNLPELKKQVQQKRKEVKEEYFPLYWKRRLSLRALRDFKNTLEKEFEWTKADRFEKSEEAKEPPIPDDQPFIGEVKTYDDKE